MNIDPGTPIYRGMTRLELTAAYDNSAAVADSKKWLEEWGRKSEKIRARSDARLDMRYGDAPRALLDYFPCGTADAPLFVFIHGGYWQRNHKDIFAFVAEGPLAAGFNVASLGYTLAPDASLTNIVEEMKSALAFLSGQADELGFQADKMIVGGWSAGGHLAASMMDQTAVAAILPISGIFDLEPIALCGLNDALQLTPNEVETLSPISALPDRSIPVCVAYGGNELPELQRQSTEFAKACSERGFTLETLALAGHHHFSILDELSATNGKMVEALRRLAG